jgi:hypothetical protein
VHVTPAAATRAPSVRTQPPNRPQAPARELPDIDWGEEIPTLVQRPTDPPLPQAPASAESGPGDEPVDVDSGELVDEDSTEDPTLVEQHGPHSPLVEAARSAAAAAAREIPGHRPEPAVTEQMLRAHADRLATDAARLNEQARAAAAQAERAAALAAAMSEAASLALQAMQIADAAGFVEAGRRLTEALALEQSVSGSADAVPSGMPVSHAPPSHPPPSHVPPSHTSPSYTPPSQPPPSQTAPSHQAPQGISPAVAPAMAAPPASASFAAPASAPLVPRADDDSSAADAFRAHLNPRLFGLPRTAAIALIAAAVLLILLILIFRG